MEVGVVVGVPIRAGRRGEASAAGVEFRQAAPPPSNAPLRQAVYPEKTTASVVMTKTSMEMTALSMTVSDRWLITKISTEMTTLSVTVSDSLDGDDKDLYGDDSFVYDGK